MSSFKHQRRYLFDISRITDAVTQLISALRWPPEGPGSVEHRTAGGPACRRIVKYRSGQPKAGCHMTAYDCINEIPLKSN
jgi:hypothetical protein